VPEQALVEAAAIEERIDDQLPGVVENARRRRQVAPALRQSTPRSASERDDHDRRHDARRLAEHASGASQAPAFGVQRSTFAVGQASRRGSAFRAACS
jgi:hypothetical protein